jgi:hypothetical protein
MVGDNDDGIAAVAAVEEEEDESRRKEEEEEEEERRTRCRNCRSGIIVGDGSSWGPYGDRRANRG